MPLTVPNSQNTSNENFKNDLRQNKSVVSISGQNQKYPQKRKGKQSLDMDAHRQTYNDNNCDRSFSPSRDKDNNLDIVIMDSDNQGNLGNDYNEYKELTKLEKSRFKKSYEDSDGNLSPSVQKVSKCSNLQNICQKSNSLRKIGLIGATHSLDKSPYQKSGCQLPNDYIIPTPQNEFEIEKQNRPNVDLELLCKKNLENYQSGSTKWHHNFDELMQTIKK